MRKKAIEMNEVAVRSVSDPKINELRDVLRYEVLYILLPDGKWHPPESGLGYVQIMWCEGLGYDLKKCEVRGPALLRGLIVGHSGDPLPDCLAMRACAIAIHDYYKQCHEHSHWKWP